MKRFELFLIGLVGLTGFASAAFAGQDEWTTNGPDATPRTIKALTIDTTNPVTLYAGTNRGEVFKTIDGAQTWELATEDLPRAPVLEQDFGIRVAVDPSAPNTLYAATASCMQAAGVCAACQSCTLRFGCPSKMDSNINTLPV